ncbi:hypothetical protein SANA_25630 [Gottschalkiaceae bacterium SANA]|nr:hypothetical protein SANA_25630 [Gottschalkiaceae bacterium SANA]
MDEFTREWFTWFEEGMEAIDKKQKSLFFSICAKNCVKKGVLKMYQEFYKECGKDLDVFYSSLSTKGYGDGLVIESQRVYELAFSKCTCELSKRGYVKTNQICECSRQSILHIMQSLRDDITFEVETLSTILDGSEECRFLIKIVA